MPGAYSSRWRHQMDTFSALLAFCAGNSPVTGEFPTQMPVTRGFDVFFDLRLNEQLSKQSWGWWFETPLCSLWRQCNDHELDADAYMVDRHWPIKVPWPLTMTVNRMNRQSHFGRRLGHYRCSKLWFMKRCIQIYYFVCNTHCFWFSIIIPYRQI